MNACNPTKRLELTFCQLYYRFANDQPNREEGEDVIESDCVGGVSFYRRSTIGSTTEFIRLLKTQISVVDDHLSLKFVIFDLWIERQQILIDRFGFHTKCSRSGKCFVARDRHYHVPIILCGVRLSITITTCRFSQCAFTYDRNVLLHRCEDTCSHQ